MSCLRQLALGIRPPGERPQMARPRIPRRLLKISQDGLPPNSYKNIQKMYLEEFEYFLSFCFSGSLGWAILGNFSLFRGVSGSGDLGLSPWQPDWQS